MLGKLSLYRSPMIISKGTRETVMLVSQPNVLSNDRCSVCVSCQGQLRRAWWNRDSWRLRHAVSILKARRHQQRKRNHLTYPLYSSRMFPGCFGSVASKRPSQYRKYLRIIPFVQGIFEWSCKNVRGGGWTTWKKKISLHLCCWLLGSPWHNIVI